MSKSAAIYQRLLNPQFVEHDGQRLILEASNTEALMAEAAAEIKRLHDIIYGDGSWDGDEKRD